MTSRFVDLLNEYEDIDIAEIDELTITDQLILENNTNQITFGEDPNQVQLNVDTSFNSIINIPSIKPHLIADVVLTETDQSINGDKTFNDSLTAASGNIDNLNSETATISNLTSSNGEINVLSSDTITSESLIGDTITANTSITTPELDVTNNITAPNITASNSINAPTINTNTIQSSSGTVAVSGTLLANNISTSIINPSDSSLPTITVNENGTTYFGAIYVNGNLISQNIHNNNNISCNVLNSTEVDTLTLDTTTNSTIDGNVKTHNLNVLKSSTLNTVTATTLSSNSITSPIINSNTIFQNSSGNSLVLKSLSSTTQLSISDTSASLVTSNAPITISSSQLLTLQGSTGVGVLGNVNMSGTVNISGSVTANNGLSVNNGVTFTNSTVTSYVPTPINYYEEYTVQGQFVHYGHSNLYANLTFIRTNKKVDLILPAVNWQAHTNSSFIYITIPTGWPTRFLPPTEYNYCGYYILTSTSSGNSINVSRIVVDGVSTVYIETSVGGFITTVSQTIGIYPITLTYLVN